MQNYFALFQLPVTFDIDLASLDSRYRALQAEVHPDRFVSASPAERMASMQAATLANEAYQTLKHPTARARYMLHLQGVATGEEDNTAMPADFLMTQMEWREAMAEAQAAHDIAALDRLLREIQDVHLQLQQQVRATLSTDAVQAAAIVRKLRFIDKVTEDVHRLISQLED